MVGTNEREERSGRRKGREAPDKFGATLLALARDAIETRFTRRKLNQAHYAEKRGLLAAPRGLFVTLTKEGKLRGCIGYPHAQFPLWEAVIHAARAAAFDDPRFDAVEPEELGSIRIEVTVLTEPKRLIVTKPEEYLRRIEIGRDGLIIRQGYRSGLLLPQVPVEYGWSVETYLEQLCLKAGLPRQAWREPGVEIEAFQGRIYAEE